MFPSRTVMTPSAGKRAEAAEAAQRAPDPSEQAMRQESITEVRPPTTPATPSRLDFSAPQLRSIVRESNAIQARLKGAERPAALTTEEVYTMVCNYRYNIQEGPSEDLSLRNTLAVLWAERCQPDAVDRLLRDIYAEDFRLAQEWTSSAELTEFLTTLTTEHDQEKAGRPPRAWVFPNVHPQSASSPRRDDEPSTRPQSSFP
jgi:hypothetical protein